MTQSTTPLVSLRGVGRIGRDRQSWLFRDWSLQISAGEQLFICGPSGAGKSLLMRTIAGLDPLDEGDLNWCGRTILDHDMPRYRSHVIYLPQRPFLWEGTVEDNLRLPFSFSAHRGRTYSRTLAAKMLSRVGKSDSFLSKQHTDLSGGEAQWLCLARAMQLEPQVLLLDEALSGLDTHWSLQMEQSVIDWTQQRPAARAVVWVSHQDDQRVRRSNRTIRIDHGQLRTE